MTKLEPWAAEPTGWDVGYMLRTSSANGDSRQVFQPNFRWPRHGYVEAKNAVNVASTLTEGLYGLLDGIGDWNMLRPHADAIWQVVAVLRSECLPDPTGRAVRAPRGWVVYSGDAVGALKLIVPEMIRSGRLRAALCDDALPEFEKACGLGGVVESSGDAAALGLGGSAATVGLYRTAVSTNGGRADATGLCGSAFAISGGHAYAPALYGTAVAKKVPGKSSRGPSIQPPSSANAGERGIAAVLTDGSACAGNGGAIVLTEWAPGENGDPFLKSVFASKVGENGIKAGTFYRLVDGEPQEVPAPWMR